MIYQWVSATSRSPSQGFIGWSLKSKLEYYKNKEKAFNCLTTHDARTLITQSRFWTLKFVIQKQRTGFFFFQSSASV